MNTKRAPRRFDPDRRERILNIALDVIAEYGVVETSLRRVAAAADVPLGSMTYHFTDRTTFLCESFAKFADEMFACFAEKMDRCTSREDAVKAVVDHICGEGWASRRNLLLCYELYAFSGRGGDPGRILLNWLEQVREKLLVFFDRRTSDGLDALLEGYSIHCSVDHSPPSREDIQYIVMKITQ
ncbi:TetR family transcriptional regulator [Vibrio parahaemolyticus]|uniref:TetR/AcrR family transcriptional regulator n=1 Tax=Vibrio parahaemolyticus TaxID=670 RepID=UPI001EE9D540|nr:TetR family transcriptional regulator [Vibrio parahaemolyticus]MCG6489968.1 TetR family transcriptional regulator [Vibrio parahaemolyticus]